jgi:cytochrome c oxidase cbb3-type subunit 3
LSVFIAFSCTLHYASIVFSAIYLVRFEIMDGDNQEMENCQAKLMLQNMKTAPDFVDEKQLLCHWSNVAEGRDHF